MVALLLTAAFANSTTCTGKLDGETVTLVRTAYAGGPAPYLGMEIASVRLTMGGEEIYRGAYREGCFERSKEEACMGFVADVLSVDTTPVLDAKAKNTEDGGMTRSWKETAKVSRTDGKKLGDLAVLEVTWTCESVIGPPIP